MKNTHQEKLFDTARKAPTELSQSKVEAMIKGFPTVPPSTIPPSNTNNWTHYFSLNNLIMITIPIAVVALLTLTSANETNNFEVTSINELSMDISKHKAPGLQYKETTVIEKNNIPVVVKNNGYKESENKSIVPTQRKHSKVKAQKSTTIQSVFVPTPTPLSSGIFRVEEQQYNPHVVSTNLSTSDHLKLTNSQLRQLKRSLYSNLFKDNLIANKRQFVKMELLGSEIKINEEQLSNNLISKYLKLTKITNVGPNRQIELDPEYIKVFHFTADGTEIVGHGTFEIEDEFAGEMEMDLESEFENKIELDLEPEYFETPFSDPDVPVEELSKEGVLTFAAKMVRKSAIKSKGKAALFPVRVKEITMFMLHKELYDQLLLDNIIAAQNDFVVIQLPRYDIAINGKKLQVPLPTKYLNIIEAYKIKHGNRRVIILSQHTISIGDLVGGEFTGTSVDLD